HARGELQYRPRYRIELRDSPGKIGEQPAARIIGKARTPASCEEWGDDAGGEIEPIDSRRGVVRYQYGRASGLEHQVERAAEAAAQQNVRAVRGIEAPHLVRAEQGIDDASR